MALQVTVSLIPARAPSSSLAHLSLELLGILSATFKLAKVDLPVVVGPHLVRNPRFPRITFQLTVGAKDAVEKLYNTAFETVYPPETESAASTPTASEPRA